MELYGNLMTREQMAARLEKVRCFILDMDGTIYLSTRLFPFTKPFLQRVEESGRRFCYFTNNSSANLTDYVEKLARMGIPADSSQIYLSTQVIIEKMQRLHPNDSFYIVGTPNLVEAFRQAGLRVFTASEARPGAGTPAPQAGKGASGADEGADEGANGGTGKAFRQSGFHGFHDLKAGSSAQEPDVVILGFDTTLTYEKISLACRYVRHGAAYYGVNMDYNCPVDDNGVIDYIPDCGSIARLVEGSTGRLPEFYGKPSRHTLDFLVRHTGFKEEELAFVGDRIYTDIAVANGTKALSVMVLTGETQMEDLAHYDYRPDIILPSLAELTELL